MPAIIEDLYVDWISKDIVEFFQKLGFQTKYTAVSQPVEKHYPFDRLYAVGSDFSRFSLFAIQFKAPERSRKGLRFRLDLNQLQQLKKIEFFNWIYYGLPYFTNPSLQTCALHLVNFVRPLVVPDLEHVRVDWSRPFFFIELVNPNEHITKHLEMHKIFDEFYKTGKSHWMLNRKSFTTRDENDEILRYEIPHCSWGELVNGLLTGNIAQHFDDKDEFEGFIKMLHEVVYKPTKSILIALDSIRGLVRIVAVLSERGDDFNQTEDRPVF